MLTEHQMAVLDDLLPGSQTLSVGLALEMGRAIGEGMYSDYPNSYNEHILELAKRLRSWLVNPPKGEYTIG